VIARIVLDREVQWDLASEEWALTATAYASSDCTPYIFLKRVWISSTIVEAEASPVDVGSIGDLLDDEAYGGQFVRTILPSEAGAFPTKTALAKDLVNRYTEDRGRPRIGFFLYVDEVVSQEFTNHSLVSNATVAMDSIVRAYNEGYAQDLIDSTAFLPVNASISSTSPTRVVIADTEVVGSVAGDVIRFKVVGGSGDNEITTESSLIRLTGSKVKVVKNETGDAVVTVVDTINPTTPASTITIRVVKV